MAAGVPDELAGELGRIEGLKAVPVLLQLICRTTGLGCAAIFRAKAEQAVLAAIDDRLATGLKPGEILDGALVLRAPVLIEDVSADPRLRDHPLVKRFRLRSCVSAPILGADGSLFGTLFAFDSAPHVFVQPETGVMFERLAELIGVALLQPEPSRPQDASASAERFLTVFGHNLRNPLTAVLGGIEMLRKYPLTERAAQWVDMITASATRMSELIDVAVDYSQSRLQHGICLELVEIDTLEADLQDTLDEFRAANPKHPVYAEIAIGEAIRCDPRRILRLVRSLADDAVHHGDPTQPLKVEAGTRDGWLELSVAHAGERIPEAALKTLFEPFARGVQSGDPWLGLSLYLAREVARAHGGSLAARSDAKETRFILRIPLHGP
jgi:signal transduction histidine kinase